METISASRAEISVTENHIKQLHRDLLRFSVKDERHLGEYEAASNSVGAFDADGNQVGIVLETASPFETPRLMAELVDWLDQAQQGELHSLLAVGIFVVVFLEIHPFQDGNGRLSQVLTTLLLLRARYAYVPYSSLESVIEQSKEGCYLALRRPQGTIRTDSPDWTPWLTFFLKTMQSQMRRLRETVERERLLLATLPDLAIQALDHVRDHGRATIADAVAITDASRNTLKLHFKLLRERGLLVLHGQGRGLGTACRSGGGAYGRRNVSYFASRSWREARLRGLSAR